VSEKSIEQGSGNPNFTLPNLKLLNELGIIKLPSNFKLKETTTTKSSRKKETQKKTTKVPPKVKAQGARATVSRVSVVAPKKNITAPRPKANAPIQPKIKLNMAPKKISSAPRAKAKASIEPKKILQTPLTSTQVSSQPTRTSPRRAATAINMSHQQGTSFHSVHNNLRRQYFHGDQNGIHLSTDHTMLVSRLYCLKKQFTDYKNKNHFGPLISQLLYYLGHPMVVPHDARFFSEWSGAVEPILLHWCNEARDINTDGSVGNFLNLDIQVIKQMWDNVIFAVQDEHINENTHIAHVFPNIKKNNFNVLYRQDIRMVQQDSFLGNNHFEFLCGVSNTTNWLFCSWFYKEVPHTGM
jgi:hypothetical protein